MYGFLKKKYLRIFCRRVLRRFAGSRGKMEKAMFQMPRRKIRQRKETICKRYVVMLCNNSISTIHKKISLRLPKAFRRISLFLLLLFLQAFPYLSSSVLLLSSLPPLRVFPRKTHPAPSARFFGAMRRLERWY